MKRAVIGILAHVDSGKTTLSEAMLYTCGRLKKQGRVDRGDAFLDTYALERQRGITIFSKQAVFEYGDTSFTLIDTPGHVDFSSEMERTLSVLDAAVLVVSGPEGIQAHTRTLWKLFARYDVPVFIFINKMDRCELSRDDIMKELKKQLDSSCVDMTGEMDLDMCERIALCDEELLEAYLETGTLTDDDVADLIGRRQLFPCFFGSALRCEGIDRLLPCLDRYMPVTAEQDAGGKLSGRIFKITHDSEGNRLTHMRVSAGSVRTRDMLGDEKITSIRVYSGDSFTPVNEALPGMVVAFTGLSATHAGQPVGDEEELPAPELMPVMTYRVDERDRSRLLKLIPLLRAIEEEEPSLDVIWNEELKELQVRIMGEIELDVLRSLLRERFGEDVAFDSGSILYRETVASKVLGVGHFEPLRHYAEAQLLIEPGEPGSGITAESVVSTDDLEMNWQRLILTHIFEREHRGVLTGSVLTDVHFTLVAGRSHIKHTEGGDFRQATYRAIRQGLMKAESVLLEPYYRLELDIPRELCGRAMTDIEKRYGHISGQDETEDRDMIILRGYAPASTMQGYVKEVTAYSKGRGSLYMTFYGYLPCHNTAEVIAALRYDPAADLRNPSSSVFCAHGSGFIVEWDEVDRYKHVDYDMETGRIRRDEDEAAYEARVLSAERAGRGRAVTSIGTDEIDAIIERTLYSNRKSKEYRNPFRKQRAAKPQVKDSGSSHERTRTFTENEKYLLVDGYNIIFAWPELAAQAKVNIDGAREKLNDIMCDYQAVRKGHVLVVYDAYRVSGHPEEFYRYGNIELVFTKQAETADRFIERFAHENAKRFEITVATSDGVEQIIIRGAGSRLMTASDLLEDVKRLRKSTMEKAEAGAAPIGTSLGTLFDLTGPL